VVLWTFGPIYWAIVVSLTTQAGITAVPPPVYPHPFTLHNYEQLLTLGTGVGRSFARAFANSVIEAGLTTIISVAAGLAAAYGFVRLRLRGARVLFIIIVATLAIPAYVLLVPLFRLVVDVRQANTYQAVALILAAGNMPLAVWLLRSHVAALPTAVQEAAQVDGARHVTILTRVVVPLVAPGLAGTAVLVFLTAWGAFLIPLVFATTVATQPLPVLIPQYTTKFVQNYGLQAAAGVLALLPPALLAVLMRRYLIQGILGTIRLGERRARRA
jgi:multiple sugar transport system permease protein